MTAPVEPVENFTFIDYLLAQQAINAAYAATIYPIIAPYAGTYVTAREWANLVALLFQVTKEFRYQAAEIARKFYDSERAKHVDIEDLPEVEVFSAERLSRALGGLSVDVDDRTQIKVPEIRHPVRLARYDIDDFIEALAKIEAEFRRPEPQVATDWDAIFQDPALRRERVGKASLKLVSVGLKEVEDGGRETILEAVNSDRVVKGWARVAGGEDSCAFCLMLISRGPVYFSARTAGFSGSDKDAVGAWDQFLETGNTADYLQVMTAWHPNCDCKVVPVFDENNWPGRDHYLEMLKLWKEVTEGYSAAQNNKDKPHTADSDALNAFRRYIERGTRNRPRLTRVA